MSRLRARRVGCTAGFLAAGLLLGASVFAPASAWATTSLGEDYQPAGTHLVNAGATSWVAQSFVPATGTYLKYVEFKLNDVGEVGNRTGEPFTVELRADSANSPTGAILATAEGTGIPGLTEWARAHFTSTPFLSATTQYWLVVRSERANADSYSVLIENNSTYAGGDMAHTPDAGVTWNLCNANGSCFNGLKVLDLLFRTYVGSPTLLGAVARDASSGGAGIQAGDTVTLTFDAPTNKFAITSANIDTVLALNNAHVWGTIGSATWSADGRTLTVTLGAVATVAPADTITIGAGTIQGLQGGADASGSPPAITRNFGVSSCTMQSSILIWDADRGQTYSAAGYEPAIRQALIDAGVAAAGITTTPQLGSGTTFGPDSLQNYFLPSYEALFVTLGGWNKITRMNGTTQQQIRDFMAGGGDVYVEGSMWGFVGGSSPLYGDFAQYVALGNAAATGNVSSLTGDGILDGFTTSFSFQALPVDDYTEVIAPRSGGQVTLRSQDGKVRGVQYDAGTHQRFYLTTVLTGMPTVADRATLVRKILRGFRCPVATPVLAAPFDHSVATSTTPTVSWQVPAAAAGTQFHFKVQWDVTSNHLSPFKARSSAVSAAGFSNVAPCLGPPYPQGCGTVTYTLQAADAMTNGSTYWWNVSANDLEIASSPAVTKALTIGTSVSQLTWHKTTTDQFLRDTHTGAVASGGKVAINQGGSNVALESAGSTATATSAQGGSAADEAIDGDTLSQWAGNRCASVAAPEEITVNLGVSRPIAKINFYLDPADPDQKPVDFTFQTSPDGTTWTVVDTVTGNAATSYEKVLATQVTAQYTKISVTKTRTSGGCRYVWLDEFRVIDGSYPAGTTVTEPVARADLGGTWPNTTYVVAVPDSVATMKITAQTAPGAGGPWTDSALVDGPFAGPFSGSRTLLTSTLSVVPTHLRFRVEMTPGSTPELQSLSVGAASVPLSAEGTFLAVQWEDERVRVSWDTSNEDDVLAFDVLRAPVGLGAPEPITVEPVPASGSSVGASYDWIDATVAPDTAYDYWIDERLVDGTTRRVGPVSALPSSRRSDAGCACALSARGGTGAGRAPGTGMALVGLLLGAAVLRRRAR